MGGDTTPSWATVQTGGYGYRLKAGIMVQAFNAGACSAPIAALRPGVDYANSQTAVCNRHHTIEQQLSRWLLLTLDRLNSQELIMTQELIASMLGVRREGITEAAGRLQQAGIIRYRRGHITVLDREGLTPMSASAMT